MLVAIETKYLGPTNFKGSRVKAIETAGLAALAREEAAKK